MAWILSQKQKNDQQAYFILSIFEHIMTKLSDRSVTFYWSFFLIVQVLLLLVLLIFQSMIQNDGFELRSRSSQKN